jgi:hypothetical protein
MEAVVALGVAGNVLQFLDFGQKLYSTSLEIHRAATGASTANAESETLLRDFIESIDTVSSDLKQYRSALDATSPQVSGAGTSALHDVVENCKVLAVELLDRFEKLRGEGNRGRWKSFMTGVTCMWKEKELQDLQGRLGRYRSQLEWRVLISLRYSDHPPVLTFALLTSIRYLKERAWICLRPDKGISLRNSRQP